MTITTTQRTRLRVDLGLADDETIFTNAEMSDIWDRVSGASSEIDQHFAALGLMAMQMLNSANKLHDYRVVSSSESLEQVWKHWKSTFEMYKDAMQEALGFQNRQVVGSSIRRDRVIRDKPGGRNEGFEPIDPILPADYQ